MMDVSTAHSGSLRPNASAIASAPIAATVTRRPRPSSTFRDRSHAAMVLNQAIKLSLLACAAIPDAFRIPDVGARVADELVAVRHLDRTQYPGVKRRIGRKQAVQVEDIGGDRVDVVIAQRLRRVLRHGAADIIEQGRRVGPEAADGAYRFRRCQRALPADQPVADAALAAGAVTGPAAARRQVVAMAVDVDVPAGDLR